MKLFAICLIAAINNVVASSTTLSPIDVLFSGGSILHARDLLGEHRILPRTNRKHQRQNSLKESVEDLPKTLLAGIPSRGRLDSNELVQLGRGSVSSQSGGSASSSRSSSPDRNSPASLRADPSRTAPDSSQTATRRAAEAQADISEGEAAAARRHFRNTFRREGSRMLDFDTRSDAQRTHPQFHEAYMDMLRDHRFVAKAKMDQATAYRKAAVDAEKAGRPDRQDRNNRKAIASSDMGQYIHAELDRKKISAKAYHNSQEAWLGETRLGPNHRKVQLARDRRQEYHDKEQTYLRRVKLLSAQAMRSRRAGGKDSAPSSQSESSDPE